MFVVIIIVWVLVAGAVFFSAMRGGPRGAREALYKESGPGQGLVTVVIVVTVLLGLTVPALVIAANAEHKAREAVGGITLNARQEKGRELFAHSCAVCHTLSAVKSVGRTGPNLDVKVGEEISTYAGRRALVLSAIMEGRARGLGQMPALLYEGKEAEDVADFVAVVAGR